MVNLVLFLLGLLLLTAGGEALIRGSLAAAKRFGVSPLLSGLVIVGFGTSMPELVVSVNAAIDGQPDIAIGNVVGSNIGNILLILGVCALITPLTVTPLALRRDAITVIVASLLFITLVGGSALGRIDALVFLVCLAAYLGWAYFTERQHSVPSAALHQSEAESVTAVPTTLRWIFGALLIGLALLIVGSQVVLKGAIGMAQHFGIPESVVGLTLVAVGTSLPELSISVIAAVKKQADVAVGNILGSNIFNLLGILGISAALQPLPVPARVLNFDQWVMLGTALLLFAFLYTGRRLNRIEGAGLLMGYGLYVWFSFSLI